MVQGGVHVKKWSTSCYPELFYVDNPSLHTGSTMDVAIFSRNNTRGFSNLYLSYKILNLLAYFYNVLAKSTNFLFLLDLSDIADIIGLLYIIS